MANAVPAFKRLLEVFNRLGISYAVGGSLASSVHGIPRATIDIDIIVDLQQQRIEPFARKLEADFYADPVVIQDCIDAGRSFNLIHYQSGYKFVLFPLSPDPYYSSRISLLFSQVSPVLHKTRCSRRGRPPCRPTTGQHMMFGVNLWKRSYIDTTGRAQWPVPARSS